MSQPNANFEKLAWASALVSCAFAQGHESREYTRIKVTTNSLGIPTHSLYGFTTIYEVMKTAFDHRLFREKNEVFSANFIAMDHQNSKYKAFFSGALLMASIQGGL